MAGWALGFAEETCCATFETCGRQPTIYIKLPAASPATKVQTIRKALTMAKAPLDARGHFVGVSDPERG